MTRYRVFRKVTGIAVQLEESTVFVPVGEYEANDGKGAVRAAILAMPESQQAEAATQTFAACASSAWQELSPKVKVETTVSFA